MQQTSTNTPATAANAPRHRLGQDVNVVDQVSSPVLLGLAVAGAVVALLLIRIVVG